MEVFFLALIEFLLFIAVLLMIGNASKISRIQRALQNETSGREANKSAEGAFTEYVGKGVDLDFYDDEEGLEMLERGKNTAVTLVDADEQWALIHVKSPRREYDRVIRLSSIKGISEK